MHRFVQCVTLGGVRLSVTYAILTNEKTKNLKCYTIYNYDKAEWENMNEYLTNFDF